MSTSLLITDAIRARDPIQAWYSSATNSTVLSALKPDGTTSCYHYNHGTQRLFERTAVFPSYGDDNTHITAAMAVLAAGGPRAGRAVFALTGHNNQTRIRATMRSGKVGALAAQVTNGINSATYPFLAQMNDTAKTLYLFNRRVAFGTPDQWFRDFHTSTDGGATWSSLTSWLVSDDGGNEQRPYAFPAHVPGSSRVDFITTRGHWNAITDNALFHVYFTVDAAGARSWFKSDGTQIGTGDSALPLDNTDLTTIIGPTSGKQWLSYDQAWIGGVLTVLFTEMTPYDESTNHDYYITQLVSGSWTTPEHICSAGETGTEPHEQYVNAWHITGGGCLDPNDANAVYLSRKYGSGDFRLEKWTKSGTWSKALDISGNTGSMNLDPFWVRESPTTQIMYTRGTISGETTWDMDIYTYPALLVKAAPAARVKPTSQAWNAALAAALYPGVNFFVPFTEGTGTTANDACPDGGFDGTLAGNVAWQSGTYGPHVGNFPLATDRITHAFPYQPIGTAFPCWTIAVYKTTETGANLEFFNFGLSSSSTPYWRQRANNTAAGNIGSLARGSVGTGGDNNTAVSANDGNWHVHMHIWYSATEWVHCFDGTVYVLTPSVSGLNPFPTLDRMTTGVLGINSYLLPAGANTSIAAVIGGEGDVPDPLEVYEDLILGTYAVIRPTDTRGAYRTGANMLQHGLRSGGIL